MNGFVGQSLSFISCLWLLLNPLSLHSPKSTGNGRSSTVTPMSTASFESEDDATWQVPICSSIDRPPKGKRIKTPTFQFVVPDNLLLKKITDVDYTQYIVLSRQAKKNGAVEYLEIWFGASSVATSLPQDLVGSSAITRRRSWSCEKLTGSDFRGELTDRTYWRWINLPLGVAKYRTKSPELAAAFDSVIESFCCKLDLLRK